MLSILLAKGYLERRREGLSFLYKPTVDEHQARRTMVGDLLKRAFDGKAALMVAAMIEGRDVREEDLEEITRLIAERQKEDL
jgi:predicted transcriptional regulator